MNLFHKIHAVAVQGNNHQQPKAAALGCLYLCLAIASRAALAADASATNAAEDARLDSAVKFLASDELEGRGPGTKGIDLAADYIALQFRAIGLKTDSYDGTPFQKFSITTATKLGPEEKNSLTLVGPDGTSPSALRTPNSELPAAQPPHPSPLPGGEEAEPEKTSKPAELKLGSDFSPLAIGGSGQFDVPLVFVGYGITAPKIDYDDYAGIDAKGKAVVVLRHEPQQNDEHSVFDGKADSQYAPIARKVSNAYEHGAEAVLLVTDDAEVEKNIRNCPKARAAINRPIEQAERRIQSD